jgi:hypothetical protein
LEHDVGTKTNSAKEYDSRYDVSSYERKPNGSLKGPTNDRVRRQRFDQCFCFHWLRLDNYSSILFVLRPKTLQRTDANSARRQSSRISLTIRFVSQVPNLALQLRRAYRKTSPPRSAASCLEVDRGSRQARRSATPSSSFLMARSGKVLTHLGSRVSTSPSKCEDRLRANSQLSRKPAQCRRRSRDRQRRKQPRTSDPGGRFQ